MTDLTDEDLICLAIRGNACAIDSLAARVHALRAEVAEARAENEDVKEYVTDLCLERDQLKAALDLSIERVKAAIHRGYGRGYQRCTADVVAWLEKRAQRMDHDLPYGATSREWALKRSVEAGEHVGAAGEGAEPPNKGVMAVQFHNDGSLDVQISEQATSLKPENKVTDLMQALQDSLAAAKAARSPLHQANADELPTYADPERRAETVAAAEAFAEAEPPKPRRMQATARVRTMHNKPHDERDSCKAWGCVPVEEGAER